MSRQESEVNVHYCCDELEGFDSFSLLYIMFMTVCAL